MDFYERMVHWSWPARLAISGSFFAFSALLLIFAHQFWIWGWIVGGVILLVPLVFREKHHEYRASDAEVLERTEITIPRETFARLLANLAEHFPRSLKPERRNPIASRVDDLQAGQSATFSLHLKNEVIESPFELTARSTGNDLILWVCGRDPALSLLKEIAAKVGASSSV